MVGVSSSRIRHAGVVWLLFLIRHPIFDWCGVTWWSKNKHHINTCLKEIGLRHLVLLNTPLSTVNPNWENLRIQLRNQQTCTSGNHNRFRGGPMLLMLHIRFARVSMISRIWRTWKLKIEWHSTYVMYSLHCNYSQPLRVTVVYCSLDSSKIGLRDSWCSCIYCDFVWCPPPGRLFSANNFRYSR